MLECWQNIFYFLITDYCFSFTDKYTCSFENVLWFGLRHQFHGDHYNKSELL